MAQPIRLHGCCVRINDRHFLITLIQYWRFTLLRCANTAPAPSLSERNDANCVHFKKFDSIRVALVKVFTFSENRIEQQQKKNQIFLACQGNKRKFLIQFSTSIFPFEWSSSSSRHFIDSISSSHCRTIPHTFAAQPRLALVNHTDERSFLIESNFPTSTKCKKLLARAVLDLVFVCVLFSNQNSIRISKVYQINSQIKQFHSTGHLKCDLINLPQSINLSFVGFGVPHFAYTNSPKRTLTLSMPSIVLNVSIARHTAHTHTHNWK